MRITNEQAAACRREGASMIGYQVEQVVKSMLNLETNLNLREIFGRSG
ncbi:MAG: hypothetical protein K0R28_4304 [Paenibacillus sp.]|jgi:hypothetical protein|nr:hypothetical protein [Paenibacillus sp.]